MIFENHFLKSLSLRNIVAARFSAVRRQGSLRPMTLDTEKTVLDGTFVPVIERNPLARKESKP
jgi:hypothetical protein